MGALFSLVISPDSAKKVYNLRRDRRLAADEVCPAEEDRKVHADGGVHQIANPHSCYRQALSNWAWFSLIVMLGSVFINVPMLTIENYRKFRDPPPDLWMASCTGRSYNVWVDTGFRGLWSCMPGWQGRAMMIMVLFETVGLCVLLAFTAKSLFYYTMRPSGYTKWHHWDALWCDWLPMMGRFSAIKFLGKAHPAFLVLEFRRGVSFVLEDAEELLEDAEDHPMSTALVTSVVRMWTVFKIGMNITYALGMRLVVFVCGFAAFITKVKLVQDEFERNPDEHFLGIPYLWSTFVAIAFLNQALNMIDVSRRLFDLSLRFVFAGGDGLFQKHEWNMRLCYKAEVAEMLHQVFVVEQRRPLFAAAALVNFDHIDVQRLAFTYVGLEGKNKRPEHLKCDEQFRPKRLAENPPGAVAAMLAEAGLDEPAAEVRKTQFLRDCEEVEAADSRQDEEQLLLDPHAV